MNTNECACPFCTLEEGRDILFEDEHSMVIRDLYPVAEGHSLVIPKRHVPYALDLTEDEIVSIHKHAKAVTTLFEVTDTSIQGFNLGFNCGEIAGQSVPHAHYHVIPRRDGDVAEPFGGIRNIIPNKGKYVVTKRHGLEKLK